MSSSAFSLRVEAPEFTPKQIVPPLAHSPRSYDNDGSTMNETQNSSDSGRSRNWNEATNNNQVRLNPLAPEFVPTCTGAFASPALMGSVYPMPATRQPYSSSLGPPHGPGVHRPVNVVGNGSSNHTRPIRPAIPAMPSHPGSHIHHQMAPDLRVMAGRPSFHHHPSPPGVPLVPAIERQSQVFVPEVPAVPGSQPTPPVQSAAVIYQQCEFPCDQTRQASRSSNGSTTVCNQTTRPSSPIDQEPYAPAMPQQMGTEPPPFNVTYTPPIIQSKVVPGSFDAQGAVQLPQTAMRFTQPANYPNRFPEPVYAQPYCNVYHVGEPSSMVQHMVLLAPAPGGSLMGQPSQPSMGVQGPPINQQHAGPRPRYHQPAGPSNNGQATGLPDEALHMQASQQSYNQQRPGEDFMPQPGRPGFPHPKQGPNRNMGGGRARGNRPPGGHPGGPGQMAVGGRGGRGGGYAGRLNYNNMRQDVMHQQNGNAYNHPGRPPAGRLSGDLGHPSQWKPQGYHQQQPPQPSHEEKPPMRRPLEEEEKPPVPSVASAPAAQKTGKCKVEILVMLR